MPIHNSDKQIIGVTQLVNKTNGEPFNDNDVNIIEVKLAVRSTGYVNITICGEDVPCKCYRDDVLDGVALWWFRLESGVCNPGFDGYLNILLEL